MDLTPAEARCADRVIRHLGPYVDTAWTFFLECTANPARGSAIYRAKRNKDLILTLDVSLALSAATDHFQTVANVFSAVPIPRYSLFSVVRSALENDARACWLLDPTIDDAHRLARALTDRAGSLFEFRRIGKKVGNRTPAQNYAWRIKRPLSAARRWNIGHTKYQDGRIVFGVRPKITNLTNDLLPAKSLINKKMTVGQHTYAALSARTHGDPWALVGTPVGRPGRLNRRQSGVMVGTDIEELVRLLGITLQLHDRAMTQLATLAGLEPGLWEERRGPWIWNG